MALKSNIEYWIISLKNPEPIFDEYYIFDEIIVEDKDFIKNVEKLRELITAYCVILEFEKSKEIADKILDEIYKTITSTDKLQYTEFVAFWKILDISLSVFLKLPNKKAVLAELLKQYCLRRKKLYDRLGYSNITVQALYDSGASRKKGTAGIKKVIYLASEVFNFKREDVYLKTMEEIKTSDIGYLLPDRDEELFRNFCSEYKIVYRFGEEHQGKVPDIVLKINNHFIIIEAKHIKESGGAQDKQIVELIEFIKYSENSEFIHYLSFMDGLYFNNFICIQLEKNSRASKQKEDIEKYLKTNPKNFFVNTAGLKEIFEDLTLSNK